MKYEHAHVASYTVSANVFLFGLTAVQLEEILIIIPSALGLSSADGDGLNNK